MCVCVCVIIDDDSFQEKVLDPTIASTQIM